jgi:predicted N-acyltransferase
MEKDIKFIGDISSIKENQYKKLIRDNDSPFIKYPFLSSLEKSGCVSDITGWKSNHVGAYDKNNIEGFLPLYIKDNSQGEFIFDHSWSYALNRTGRKYYPKLLSAIPFTPCETRKIITSGKI